MRDYEIKKMYNEYHEAFEDIDEMIAECFMVCEICDDIEFANKVKRIINNEIKK